MFERYKKYLLVILIILTLLSFVYKWESLVLLFSITCLYGAYLIAVAAYEHGRKIEPEDDPSGNTNITKKFIDHM